MTITIMKPGFQEVRDFLKGYGSSAEFACYKREDSTKGWCVRGTKSRSILLALLQMSLDPMVLNKPFAFVPRRKKPVSIEEIKAEQWFGVLKWGEYEDKPWVYSGEFTNDPSEGAGRPDTVVFLELPRKKAYTAKGATEQKYRHNPKLDRVLQVKRDLETLANQVEAIGDLSEVDAGLKASLFSLNVWLVHNG